MSYDEAYEIVVNMAKAKMTMNAHKGRIENLNPDRIVDFCIDEAEELRVALRDGTTLEIIEESADVLNFVIAAVQQALTTYRSRKNEKLHLDSNKEPVDS